MASSGGGFPNGSSKTHHTSESAASNASTSFTADISRASERMAQQVVQALDSHQTTTATAVGALKSPRECGVPTGTTEALDRPAPRKRHPSPSRMRSIRAIRSSMSPAAAAAAVAATAAEKESEHLEPSMVCSMAFRGMEVIFALVQGVDASTVVGLCARTRVAFQTLDLPSKSASVVSLVGNVTTGMITVCMSDGVIQTYTPVETSPGPSSKPHAVVAAFGRFRWMNTRMIYCADVFYHNESKPDFQSIKSGKESGQSVHISSSTDYKVLVGHRDQLAVFDATPEPNDDMPILSVGGSGEHDATITTDAPPATLLWTTRLHERIVTCKLAGDGQAIVVVIRGEGIGTPDPFGARTFVRDYDDGSDLAGAVEQTMIPPPPHRLAERQSSTGSTVGILYKPGPFLIHSTTVTRLSFRGLGHNTSNVHSEDDEGNDLLLTYCAEDCSVRIFSQNSWKQLMHWTTPPDSRADWVHGISAFTLGDLESAKKSKSAGSRSVSRRPSFGSGDESSGGSGAINRALIGGRPFSTVAATNAAAPSTAAGAWICEITFRNAFPALRLSRLTYMKRGSEDCQPAHFESVAAILPAGSVTAASLLDSEEMGLTVQGIWPAWNPWLSGAAGTDSSGSLSGSAMALLGFPSGAAASAGASFGETNFGGTHSPPSELRLVASHQNHGKVVLMEFPLWGDQDFGAMELGSPLRYVLSVSEDQRISSAIGCFKRNLERLPVCMDHESSRLCARIETGAKSVSLTWRRQGSMYILPGPHHSINVGISMVHSLASTISVDSKMSHHTFDSNERHSRGPEPYSDISVVPVPLTLPTLRLPRNESCSHDETIVALMWWPDDNFGAPLQLAAITSRGTFILYEMPPPWSVIEPPMPSYDPLDLSTASSLAGGDGTPTFLGSRDSSDEDSTAGVERKEYETMITPHVDFGIGLRLESQAEGMPAIAGSYKKNPLTGGRLPAERTGMIVLGDELVAINGVSLEGRSFDDIIGTVRRVGSAVNPGAPLCMRFRPNLSNRRRIHSGITFDGEGSPSSKSSRQNGRRTIEQILGVSPSPKQRKRKDTKGNESDSDDSQFSVLVGAESEMQQEFSRIVAMVRNALDIGNEELSSAEAQSLIELLPWHVSIGTPDLEHVRGAALLVSARKSTLCTKRIEVAADGDPNSAQCVDLGSVDLQISPASIRSLVVVKPRIDGWCLAVCDSNGAVTLVFVEIEVDAKSSDGSGRTAGASPANLRAVFRYHLIIQCNTSSRLLYRAASVELMATMPQGEACRTLTVWSACPQAVDVDEKEKHHSAYVQSHLSLNEDALSISSNEIVDFRFVPSGSLDSFPWIVLLSRTAAVVHRRSCVSHSWEPIAEMAYSGLANSTHQPNLGARMPPLDRIKHVVAFGDRVLSPSDAFPHLVPALRDAVSACDERKNVRSDWHPDSILAYVCTESEGAKRGLSRRARGIFEWLSSWMSQDDQNHPTLNLQFPLGVTPLLSLNEDRPLEENQEQADNVESAANLMASFSLAPSVKQTKPLSEEQKLLRELQKVLCPAHASSKHENNDSIGKRSKEFLIAMGQLTQSTDGEESGGFDLPPPLRKLNRDELRLLWAIGEVLASPPNFKALDVPGQLTLFCTSLLRHIDAAAGDEEVSTNDASFATGSRPLFSIGHSHQQSSKVKRNNAIPSAGMLSALISDHQGFLLERCRSPNEKMDWPTARQLRLPFWIRSDSELRKIAEEIGQRTYKDTRDVMNAALYFIAVRNMRTLRNLAATDQSTSGRTFLKFITNHDFSSQRGRKAAEKNAYSLLRKRRYSVAAAFFILAEPPMLKTALEVIVNQMEDLDLAFMIARLVENAVSPSQSNGVLGGLASGGINLQGMGGGGGFASGGVTQSSYAQFAEQKYVDWKPKLGKCARKLIKERGLGLAELDSCLKATQLLWLGRVNEASSCLAEPVYASKKNDSPLRDAVVPQLVDHDTNSTQAAVKQLVGSANARVLEKTSSLINFTSCPIILKAMRAQTREIWASALLVSRALGRRGIEIPSMQLLLDTTDPTDLDNRVDTEEKIATKELNGKGNQAIAPSTSIFDAFDAPRPTQAPPMATSAASSDPMTASSSIFDTFDAPPPKKPSKPAQAASSSIFDTFDAPPKKPAKPTHMLTATNDVVNNDPMAASSSIFDTFDVPTKKPAATATVSTSQDTMTSSIFDSFDAPQAKSKSVSAPKQSQSTEMSSSIFDSFDAPPARKAPTPQPDKQKSTPTFAESASSGNPAASSEDTDDNEEDADTVSMPTPRLWLEWRVSIIETSVARRFVREVARIISQFHGDAQDDSMKLFRRHIHPLVPHSAAEVLRTHCDGDALLGSVRRALDELSEMSSLGQRSILDKSLDLLACQSQPKRIIFAVLLYAVMGRSDLAEDVVRDVSQNVMQMCDGAALLNDDLVYNRKTFGHMSSQYLRRQAARLSWQLELCLWLHRGGTFSLSSTTVKEAAIAVRIALFVASWGRSHECIEKMIRCELDMISDYEAGRQLWSSMKLISSPEEDANKASGATSGGWEFLVDCSRDEATDMLRNRPPGSFIIRPHTEDHGVFTLSFKTNLTPTVEGDEHYTADIDSNNPAAIGGEEAPGGLPKPANARPVKKDEVVQHAIIRLSDSGFRCGSFGPFSSLMKLLEAVSGSLPFALLFNEPPTERIIQDLGGGPSPNSLLFRKLALATHSESLRWNAATRQSISSPTDVETSGSGIPDDVDDDKQDEGDKDEFATMRRFGLFSLLLSLSEIRKSVCAVAAADLDPGRKDDQPHPDVADIPVRPFDEVESVGSISDESDDFGVEQQYADASRIVRPFLSWCRLLEIAIALELAPSLDDVTQATEAKPVALTASDTAIEVAPTDVGSCIDGGDAVIRQLIQPDSGVEFRTLRVGEGGDSAMLVLFNKKEAAEWFVSRNLEKNADDASARLELMEKRRVIEQVDLGELAAEDEVRYRFVDPWEVEALGSKEGETMAAALGRERFYEFSIARIASSCEFMQRSLGGLHLMGLWSAAKGGVCLTKAVASVHPPWERDAGGDLQMVGGVSAEPSSFSNSIREHLYRNALFRRLTLPQRFLALVQVELLDLKNLTSPGGSSSLTVYALLRLKRPGSGAPLSLKARTLDSSCTPPTKITKTSGPNAPASWGSLVRFRFPLPEDVNFDGISFDGDREALFKGPPCALQISVYEKKFMKDILIGGADVQLDSLAGGRQLEEWVPLRAERDGIHWFARIRLTLRFELMCLETHEETTEESPPSVGLRKIQELSKLGGAHEDPKGVAKSVSTPDLLSYFESMVY